MHKHFIPLKKSTNYLLLVAILLVASCTKEQSTTQEQIDPKLQQEIRSYQNGNEIRTISFNQFKAKINLATLGTLQQTFEKPKFSKEGSMLLSTEQTYDGFALKTDSIKVLTTANGHTSYIFPVILSSPRAITFQNLTIDQSTEGTRVFVNTYTPTKKWIADRRAGKAGKFEGEIAVVYLSGLPPITTNNNKTNITGNGTLMLAPSECSTTYYETIEYPCASGNHWPGDNCYLTGNDRAGSWTFSYTIDNCNSGGGGGGTTPTPPSDYNPCDSNTPIPPAPDPNGSVMAAGNNKIMIYPPVTTPCDIEPVDCAGVPGGTAYTPTGCTTCIGGTTGLTACPREIRIDTSARKCLDTLSKGIISSASVLSAFQKIFTIETNSNNVADMINRISQSSDWNVGIREGNLTSETNYAGDIIETNAQTSASQGMVYVTFSKSYLNQATNLSVARTMIHELMHAYFVYGMAMPLDPGYTKFVEANDLLYKKNGNPIYDQNDAQHEQIANKYVSQMSILLEAYAVSMGIQSPDPAISLADYCKDLAWGGLIDTKAYRKYATNKSRIEKHLKSEAKNEANSTKKKGC